MIIYLNLGLLGVTLSLSLTHLLFIDTMIKQNITQCKKCYAFQPHNIEFFCSAEYCPDEQIFTCVHRDHQESHQPEYDLQPKRMRQPWQFCEKAPLAPVVESLKKKMQGKDSWKAYNKLRVWIDSWIASFQAIKKQLDQKAKQTFSGLENHQKQFISILKQGRISEKFKYRKGLGFYVKQSLRARPKTDVSVLQKEIQSKVLQFEHDLQKITKNIIDYAGIDASLKMGELRQQYDQQLLLKLMSQNSHKLGITQQQLDCLPDTKQLKQITLFNKSSFIDNFDSELLERIARSSVTKNYKICYHCEDEVIRFLPQLKNIRAFSFSQKYISRSNDDVLKLLKQITPYLENIEELEIQKYFSDNQVAGFQEEFCSILGSFKHLKALNIKDLNMSYGTFVQLMESHQLRELNVRAINFSAHHNNENHESGDSHQYELVKLVVRGQDRPLHSLIQLKLRKLEYLKIEQEEIEHLSFISSVLDLSKLKQLHITHSYFSEDIREIQLSTNWKTGLGLVNLEVFNANNCLMNDHIFLALCQDTTHLTQLFLSKNGITDNAIKQVIPNNKSIKRLELSYNQISTESVLVIQKHLKQLKVLELDCFDKNFSMGMYYYWSRMRSLKQLKMERLFIVADMIAFKVVRNLENVGDLDFRRISRKSVRNLYLIKKFWEKPEYIYTGGGG